MGNGFRLSLLTATCLCASVASASDAVSNGHVLGYQDTKTGTFHALTAVVPDATVAPITGTVVVTFNIKLVTTFAKGTLLNCDVSLSGSSVSETTGASSFYEEEATDNVAISGTTATCKTTIPYSWLLTPASSTVIDSFSGSYSVSAVATTAAVGVALRSSSSSVFSTSKVPASGSTSSYTVNVTL
jgi:hypothetical protein